jgi:transcriptional regulator with XRE-family HTH domain
MSSEITFGSYIATIRKQKGISQKDLANMIAREEGNGTISPQYLNDIERDRRRPGSDHIIKQFAKALGVEEDYLYYLAGTLPSDRDLKITPDKVKSLYRAFRKS